MVDSQEWVAFYLSANQQGSSTDNYYGISKLDIYTSGLSERGGYRYLMLLLMKLFARWQIPSMLIG